MAGFLISNKTTRLLSDFKTGIHVILFFICVYILVQRRKKLQMVMLGVVVAMFILATVDIAFTWHVILQHTTSLYTGDSVALMHRIYPKFLCFFVNKSVLFKLCILVLAYHLTGDKFLC